jgi:medium-chain acyl-[acyl-carrier-protein] hydrolase
MSEVELVRSYPYKIRTYQVGGNGQLSLHHLFSLFQDVAHRDATRFGFAYHQMLEHDRLWVLSRMSMDIDELPSYDDEVEIQTWVKSVSGPKSEREFTLTFKGKRVVRATSLWFCLSTDDHRPARIPLERELKQLIHPEYARGLGAERIVGPSEKGEPAARSSYSAKPSDVDMVNHVNNAAYVRWVLDNLEPENQLRPISGFEINYLSEVKLGDDIEVQEYSHNDGSLTHDILNAVSGQVVCRTKTVWQKA